MLLMPLEKMSDLQGATNTDRNYTSLFKIVASAEEIGQMYLDNVTELGQMTLVRQQYLPN